MTSTTQLADEKHRPIETATAGCRGVPPLKWFYPGSFALWLAATSDPPKSTQKRGAFVAETLGHSPR